jgi:hypothetical protein
MSNIFNILVVCIYALLDGCLLFTASLMCDWFHILWLRPCKDVLERVNKYNTIQYVPRYSNLATHCCEDLKSGTCVLCLKVIILLCVF